VCEIPGRTFLIKKKINTEQFIDRMAALFRGETQISVATDEEDQSAGTSQSDEQTYLVQKCFLGLKRCGNERSSVNLS